MSEIKKEQVPMEELHISHGDWVESIINVQGSNIANQSQTQKPRRIQRVPQMLRHTKDFEKYYAPRIVSIGPYHCHCKVQQEGQPRYYQNSEFQQMQKLKGKMASKFVSNDQQNLQGLYNKIFGKMKEVRECYEENSTKDFGDEALARMMLMDGCFILYYIKCVVDEDEKGLEMKSHQKAFVQQDLFLLENQLPFLILDVLINDSSSTVLSKDEWMEKMVKFIDNTTTTTAPLPLKDEKKVRPTHLLEFLHIKLVGDLDPGDYCRSQSYTFRNVKELTETGIHLKPSETSCLTKISYEPCGMYGRLKLPPITVDESTKAKFLNLIAYEMCPDAPNDFQWVTSYVCFLDSLIDHPEDVKELRSAKILQNYLGSDDEVADLFNEIATDLVPHPCAYSFVKGEIQKHYDDRGKTYMAQLKHQYFKNPWTVFALAGAILALFFSAVQAYFQVWSLPSECDGLCKHIRLVEHL